MLPHYEDNDDEFKVEGGDEEAVDDDGELLQDAVFLSMNAGNYWRVEDEDDADDKDRNDDLDEDWSLEMFEELVNGGGGDIDMGISQDGLDEYCGYSYEEGEYHPSKLLTRVKTQTEAARNDQTGISSFLTSSCGVENGSSPKNNSKVATSLDAENALSYAVKRPRVSSPSTSWMSTLPRRHLKFYHLIDKDKEEERMIVTESAIKKPVDPIQTTSNPRSTPVGCCSLIHDEKNPFMNDDDDDVSKKSPIPPPQRRQSMILSPESQLIYPASCSSLNSISNFAHSTPTVKRADSRLNWRSTRRREPFKTSMAKPIHEQNDRNNSASKTGTGYGKTDTAFHRYPHRQEPLDWADHNDKFKGYTRDDTIDVDNNGLLNTPSCIDRSFSNGSSSTTMTKLFLHHRDEAEFRRCLVDGGGDRCPSSIAATSIGNLSTAASSCFCGLTERDSITTTTTMMMTTTTTTRKSMKTTTKTILRPDNYSQLLNRRGTLRKRVIVQRALIAKMEVRHPDLCIFVRRTIPKLVDLGIIFVNNWMNDKQ